MRILYPILQAPVLTPAQDIEQVTESRWHQPYSEPVRFKTDPRLSVVLAATSGGIAPTFAAEIEPGKNVQTWFAPFSEPVRLKRGLGSLLQQTLQNAPNIPVVPTILSSQWFAPMSEPVRIKPRLHAALNQYQFDDLPVAIPIITERMTWFQPFTQRLYPKPGLAAHQQHTLEYPSAAFTIPPTLTRRNLYTQSPRSIWVVRYPN